MKPATLARVLRVRTLQLGLARAEEARQRDALAGEAALTARIAGLVGAIASAPQAVGARTLAATAHYRERLHQSAEAAAGRVRAAEQRTEAAAEASRTARRDQSAVEKLLDRARIDAALRDLRALEATSGHRVKRHDPC